MLLLEATSLPNSNNIYYYNVHYSRFHVLSCFRHQVEGKLRIRWYQRKLQTLEIHPRNLKNMKLTGKRCGRRKQVLPVELLISRLYATKCINVYHEITLKLWLCIVVERNKELVYCIGCYSYLE